jgi:hypothetical protein
MSGIGLTPFYPGNCRLEIRQVGSELGVSTVNPESEGLGQLCVQSAPPLQAAGKGCLLRPTGRILRLKGQGFNSPRLQIPRINSIATSNLRPMLRPCPRLFDSVRYRPPQGTAKLDRLIWNHFMSKFGWNDFATARLEELKQKHGVSDRKDIMTIADAIDLDEKRKS